MIKRCKTILLIFFIIAIVLCVFSSCTNKKSYGYVVMDTFFYANTPCWFLGDKEYSEQVFGETNPSYWHLLEWETSEEIVEIRDYEEIKGNCVYIAPNVSEFHIPVVTSKWIYYYSVLTGNADLDLSTIVKQDRTLVDNLLADEEYCVEKVALDWYSYIIQETRKDYIGKTIRDEWADLTEESEMREAHMDWDVILQEPLAYEVCTQNSQTFVLAALQRYEAIDLTALTGVGRLRVVTRDNIIDENGAERIQEKEYCLDVVGYYETKADKLLSTGVSMDKNSEEYKIVMEQLQNPVFYSVCGNFLEE